MPRKTYTLFGTMVRAAILAAAFNAIGHGATFAQSANRDHPLIGRFDGARNVGYRVFAFDEVKLVDGPFDHQLAAEQRGPGFATIEGKAYTIYYTLPAGRSPAEVIRTYEANLAERGFVPLFSCQSADRSCLADEVFDNSVHVFGQAIINRTSAPRLNGNDPAQWFKQQGRYLFARLKRDEGDVYAAIAVGEGPQGVAAVIQVVEAKSFKPGVIQGLKKE
ncbi:MAG: hypothetical protein RL291_181 [Pseudomonadota bacterium]